MSRDTPAQNRHEKKKKQNVLCAINTDCRRETTQDKTQRSIAQTDILYRAVMQNSVCWFMSGFLFGVEKALAPAEQLVSLF